MIMEFTRMGGSALPLLVRLEDVVAVTRDIPAPDAGATLHMRDGSRFAVTTAYETIRTQMAVQEARQP